MLKDDDNTMSGKMESRNSTGKNGQAVVVLDVMAGRFGQPVETFLGSGMKPL
ncbi:MAG: hypothetical protein N2C14_02175 [Planctomycetales bacterium]